MDIAISAALAVLTILMAYLGVHVTLHPAESHRTARLYKLGFGGCAILTVILVVWQGARNSKSQKALSDELDRIKSLVAHTHLRISPAAIAVPNGVDFTVPKFDPFAPSGSFGFNLDYANSGTSKADNVGIAAALMDLPSADQSKVDEWFAKADHALRAPFNGSDMIGGQTSFTSTNFLGPLSEERSAQIRNGKLTLFIMALARFSDATGSYKQEFCEWLQSPTYLSNGKISQVWHLCDKHGSETQISSIK